MLIATASISQVIDDFGPNRGNVPSNAATDDNTLLIRGVYGNFTEGSTLRLYDNGIYIGQTTLDAIGPGTWGFNTRPLINGAHRFTLRIVNSAGVEIWESGGYQVTVNSPVPADVSVDTPIISLVDDDILGGVFGGLAEDQITNDAQPTIIGTVPTDASGIARIEIAIDGGVFETVIISGSEWRFTPTQDLGNGYHTVSVRAIDGVGNISGTVSRGFVVDTQAPLNGAQIDISDDRGAHDYITNARDLQITGRLNASEAGGKIIIIGSDGSAWAQTSVQADGSWIVSVTNLIDDRYGIRIEDQAGNTTTVTGQFTVSHTVYGSDSADDSIQGFGSEDEVLFGLDGHDTLNGQGGRDSLFGGAGNDTYIVDSYDDWFEDASPNGDIDTVISTLNISINANVLSLDPVTGQTGGITVGGFANQMNLDNIENLILSGTAVSAIGNSLDNRIIGNDIGNLIYAGGGNDTVLGGLGLDTLIGELGDEILNGQDDTDLLFGNGGNDTLMGEGGDDSAVGGGGNDWLEGGIGQDDLRGNNNNDTLIGGDDSDLLTGGFANDLLVGDAMADTLSAVGGDDELLAGSGNDTVYGGGGSDSITGGAGNDWLHGGAGNDWFFNTAGGQRLSGVDTLIGGAGDDTLNLQPLSWGRQVVSFDDIVTVVNGQNVIQGVDQVNNFQGDLINSSNQIINVGGVPVRGPAQNLADQLDLRGLFTQLGYDPNDAAAAANRQAALDIRPTATTGLFEIWVDANATATEDFQLAARVQVTSGTIDLTENILF